MDAGSRELTRRAAANVAAVAFAVTYLVAVAAGADGGAALWRGGIGALAAFLAGRLLCRPVVDVVLAALARDAARAGKAADAEDDA